MSDMELLRLVLHEQQEMRGEIRGWIHELREELKTHYAEDRLMWKRIDDNATFIGGVKFVVAVIAGIVSTGVALVIAWLKG